MDTGVNFWSSYEPGYKVRECVWGGEQGASSEDGGGQVTWETMEVKGQLISAPDPLTYPDRKQRERMTELQERRRSLQALLSTRLAELRRICLQEAELTGTVPSDFPLEAGEKPPCVRRRGGVSRHGNRKYRAEEEDSQRSKPKKTLFSAALRKHSDSDHNTHTHGHGKRTVHRGCHTDDTVRSESSSTSDSTGQDNEEHVSQCRPPLVVAASPVEVFCLNKPRRNSLHNRLDHPDAQTHKPLPLLPAPPPPLSQVSSTTGPSDPGGEGGVRGSATRGSSSSDGLLDRVNPPEEEGGGAHQRGLWVNGVSASGGTKEAFRSSEALTDGRTRLNNRAVEGGGAGRGEGVARPGRGAGYSEVLLDYIWGKQQQLQRTGSRQPITAQLYNGYTSAQPPPCAPPTFRNHYSQEQRQVKVTRTKSCGPFLPVTQSQSDSHNPPLSTIQPDPHPHLQPPRPPQHQTNQDAQLEEATRSLHKALALEGLRDWYLRNTLGSVHPNQNQNPTNGKVSTGVSTKVNGGVKGQPGALHRRRTTHGVIQQSTYQTEASHHPQAPQKQTLSHSATFHGHPLHGRSLDNSHCHDSFLPLKQEVPLRDQSLDQPSPGTLV